MSRTTRFNDLATSTGPPPSAGAHRIVSVHDPVINSCALASTTQTTLTGSYAARNNTKVGLRVREVSVTVRYVVVFTF